ncbi:MAG: 2-hydroxyacid dehydrogenase [Candidatus Sumerlaeaceae bacterium]
MKKVFITRKLPEIARQLLHTGGCEVHVNPNDRPLTAEELRSAAHESDALLCLLNDKIDAQLIESAPRCRIYANYAVGYDNMDVPAATAAGVALSNTPDVLSIATAEMAWALMFAAARRLGEGERMVRAGAFNGWAPMMLVGHEITGKTLGIAGAGRIGTAMARMARGFDMRILYTKRSAQSPAMQKLGAARVELDQLLQESDFVSLHAPLTQETRHMISAQELKLMKPTAVLVNTARGPLIDEAALADALERKQIAAAGLDVYEREPQIEARLLSLDNVVLAPHLGSSTHEARAAMAELAANNILDYFDGRPPRTCINPEYVRRS